MFDIGMFPIEVSIASSTQHAFLLFSGSLAVMFTIADLLRVRVLFEDLAFE